MLDWLAHNLVALIVVVFSFGFIIFVHELGHFAIAKKVGIRVHEFALGFGPRLFSRTRGETEYCLRAFPFGGFVRMEGEDDADADPNDPGSFQNKPVLSQIAVVSGGCFMNYLCAVLVLLFIGFTHGIPQPLRQQQTTVVAQVSAGSAAERAGILPKDRIVAINGKPINSFEDILNQIRPNPGKEVTIKLQRGTEEKTFKVVPEPKDDDSKKGAKIGQIGIKPGSILMPEFRQPASALEVFSGAGEWVVKITRLPVDLVVGLVSKKIDIATVKEGTGGPLMIGQMFFEVYYKGIWTLMFFWAIICCSVGAFNLIPFPALDGARILFLGIGALRGRPLDPRKEGMLHVVGLMLLLAIMVVFTIQDVSRMLQGKHIFS